MSTDAEQTAEGAATELAIDFCGEWFHPSRTAPFSIGRDADLVIDTNPYLHRRLLVVEAEQDLWWLANTGRSISVALAQIGEFSFILAGLGKDLGLVSAEGMSLVLAGALSYFAALGLLGFRLRDFSRRAVQ